MIDVLDARQQVDAFAARRRVARVIQVHQDEIERACLQRRDRRFGRGHRVDVDPLPFEQEFQRVEQVRLIVGDQDSRRAAGNGGDHLGLGIYQSACHWCL